jgi:hypothetical protein
MTLNQRLARNLAKVMHDRDLTNVKLGEMAGVAANTVGNYLRPVKQEVEGTPGGKERSARLFEVEAIALALDLDPLALLSDDPDKPGEARSELSSEEIELIQCARRLNPRARAALLLLVDSITSLTATKR